jgi:hypothetical protein
MTKKAVELEKVEQTAVSVKPSEDVLKALREGSGTSGNDAPFVPLLTVDNSKVEEELAGGRKAMVLCSPRYNRIDRVEGDYVSTPIDAFNGIILVVKWEVFNKGNWDDSTKSYVKNGAPFFRSRLFSPSVLFGKTKFDILIDDGADGYIESLTYPELKAKYSQTVGDKTKGLFKLQCTMFVKLGEELVRVRFKGASRTAVFNYLSSFKGSDSPSAHLTKFAAKTNNEAANPYNESVLSTNDDELFECDWNKVISMQADINALFNAGKTEKLEEDVVEKEEEINVPSVTFN